MRHLFGRVVCHVRTWRKHPTLTSALCNTAKLHTRRHYLTIPFSCRDTYTPTLHFPLGLLTWSQGTMTRLPNCGGRLFRTATSTVKLSSGGCPIHTPATPLNGESLSERDVQPPLEYLQPCLPYTYLYRLQTQSHVAGARFTLPCAVDTTGSRAGQHMLSESVA